MKSRIDKQLKAAYELFVAGTRFAPANNSLKFSKNDLRKVWEAAKAGSIQDRPVVIDQYGSVNIEQHFVHDNQNFDKWFKQNFK